MKESEVWFRVAQRVDVIGRWPLVALVDDEARADRCREMGVPEFGDKNSRVLLALFLREMALDDERRGKRGARHVR